MFGWKLFPHFSKSQPETKEEIALKVSYKYLVLVLVLDDLRNSVRNALGTAFCMRSELVLVSLFQELRLAFRGLLFGG
ncbi:hypothetical protein AHiyo6_02960 [Arthrobacter sp. Hiyo6]|nr:hypothetical protein AHiyo6_02960 [Arthrobacter sp. Hiyo6]